MKLFKTLFIVTFCFMLVASSTAESEPVEVTFWHMEQPPHRVERIQGLIDEGYAKQIFISGDMGRKNLLRTYGGKPGMDYILTNFKNYFLESGLEESHYEQILVDNPKRFFQTDS